MKALSGKELCKVLEHHRWNLLRIQGSHHIFGKTGSEVRISVPVHKNKALKSGLFRHLVKQAGLTEDDLN